MPRRGENIYKRKDGRWEARYIKMHSPDGKAIYGYLYANSYRDVKEKQQQRKNIPALKPAVNVTCDQAEFRVIAENWINSLAPQIKISTQNKYQNLLDSYIYPMFGNMMLCEITHDVIEKGCNALLLYGGKKGTGLSPKTVADTLSVVRSILRFASQSGVYTSCDEQSIHIKRPAGKMRVLSRNEQTKLCKYLYSDLNGCNIGILVCLFTGLRVGEICALRWEDISISDQTIHIRQTMQRIQDKGGGGAKTKIILSKPKSACSVRSIPIPDELMRLILMHKSTQTGFFLTNSDQRYIEPRTMQNHFKRALKACDVPDANFHSLRHTFATRCVELGFDVKSLSEILGHASVNITMNRYVHPSMELKKENMSRLADLFAV